MQRSFDFVSIGISNPLVSVQILFKLCKSAQGQNLSCFPTVLWDVILLCNTCPPNFVPWMWKKSQVMLFLNVDSTLTCLLYNVFLFLSFHYEKLIYLCFPQKIP